MLKFCSQISEEFPEFFVVYGENRARYPFSNSFLIQKNKSSQSAILFDNGIGHRLIKKLKREFKIKKIYLSHWHEDHTSGCALLKEAEIYSHILDIPPLKDLDLFIDLYAVKGTPAEEEFQPVMQSLKIEPLSNINIISNNDQIAINDDLNIRVIHTPGHTAGHCSFYEPTSKIIFLADIDLTGLGPAYLCKDANVNDFEESIKKILDLDIEYAISGHYDLFIGKEKIREALNRYLNVINIRDEKVLNLLSENVPKTTKDLIKKHIIYKNYAGEYESYLVISEDIMIQNHFKRLLQKGKIKFEDGGYLLS